jgi:hypothetical protein
LVAHWASLVQGSHTREVGLQNGAAGEVHWLLSRQRTQRPVLVLQRAPSGWLAQLALLAQALHAPSAHTGSLPATAQALLTRHSAQRLVALLQ